MDSENRFALSSIFYLSKTTSIYVNMIRYARRTLKFNGALFYGSGNWLCVPFSIAIARHISIMKPNKLEISLLVDVICKQIN